MSVQFTLLFNVKADRCSDFEEFLTHMVEVVKTNDEGCEDYELYRSLATPNHYSFFESWATQADVAAHAAKPHFKEFQKMTEMLEQPPTMLRHAEPPAATEG